jgi:cathepsin F
MPRVALLLLVLVPFVLGAVISTDINVAEWKAFKTKYNKAYSTPQEEFKRYTIFQRNLRLAQEWNQEEATEVFGVTKYSDLTQEEFKSKFLGYIPSSADRYSAADLLITSGAGAAPEAFNWADHGAVTPVYNQEQCGSCWAFSATEEIESMWFMKHKDENVTIRSLSMQQIVDCDKGHGDQGCNGGDTPTAYEYVIRAGGLEEYKDYPYKGKDTPCTFQSSDISVSISGWAYVTKTKNETDMLQASYEEGPLSICVDAAPWQLYKSGIITKNCGTQLDHCVQITGWGSESNVDYWIIRNSWGADWGESGYLRVERGKNLCGVAEEVTIVTAK